MQTQTTRQTIARLIERADDLSYQELEQLLLSYPLEYGEPISQPLLARLILPRLDRLTAVSFSSRKSSGENDTSDCRRGGALNQAQGGTVSALTPTPCEEYLLLTQILLRMSPALLTPKSLVRYADLLDGYLQPLLPLLTTLSPTADAQTPYPISKADLTPTQRAILLAADLYPYFGPKAPQIQSRLSQQQTP